MKLSRNPRLAVIAALAATLALSLAACGGDDGDDDAGGTGEALSAAEYRTAADAICREFEERTDALEEPTSADGVVDFLEAGLEINREQLDELRALNPPDDLAGTHDEAMDLLGEQLNTIESAATRIRDGEGAVVVIGELSEKIEAAGDQADAKARELGLEDCGNGDSDGAE